MPTNQIHYSGTGSTYSMVPDAGGDLPAGISIDSNTGTVIVSDTADFQDETAYTITAVGSEDYSGTGTITVNTDSPLTDAVYTVTAVGNGDWMGWQKCQIRILVHDGFYYDFATPIVDKDGALVSENQPFVPVSPVWDTAPSSATYTVNPALPAGLSLDVSTGEISSSGDAMSRQLTQIYTVTATPTGGQPVAFNIPIMIQERPANKTELWAIIDAEISPNGQNTESPDLSLIDTSNITDMSSLFNSDSQDDSKNLNADYSNFNGDLSQWNVGRVTNMEQMFSITSTFNGDLEAWGTHLQGRMVEKNAMFYNSGVSNIPSWYYW